jgi:hypothetical protein
VLLLPVAASWGGTVVRWSLLGWLLTTLAGGAGGAWLISQHGTPGKGFLVAWGVCMLSRLILFVAGPLTLAPRGMDVALACLVGLFAGYVPTQTVEVVWFARKTARA